jgi:putative FmdB family regulatory protein
MFTIIFYLCEKESNMPLFNFVCEKCGKSEDRFVSNSKLDEQTCPCDEHAKMVQQFAPACNFILKGKWFKNSKGY